MNRLRMRRAIAMLKRSASVPEITLSSPQAGAVLSRDEALTIAWNATDPDSKALEIRIEYSAADDKPFRPVFAGPNRGEWSLTGSMLEMATAGRIRLVASDGFNETAVEVGPIIVKPSPPQVEILAPESDMILPHTTPVRLQAAAFGNDLKPLADKQLEWSVDGRGVGSGMDIEVRDLEVGSHVAKVVAHDGMMTNVREVKFAIHKPANASDPTPPRAR